MSRRRRTVARCEVCDKPVDADRCHQDRTACLRECAVCGKLSRYDGGLDRFFHQDGSCNQDCWRRWGRVGLAGKNERCPSEEEAASSTAAKHSGASLSVRTGLQDAYAAVVRYHSEILVESVQRVEFALWLESRPGDLR